MYTDEIVTITPWMACRGQIRQLYMQLFCYSCLPGPTSLLARHNLPGVLVSPCFKRESRDGRSRLNAPTWYAFLLQTSDLSNHPSKVGRPTSIALILPVAFELYPSSCRLPNQAPLENKKTSRTQANSAKAQGRQCPLQVFRRGVDVGSWISPGGPKNPFND